MKNILALLADIANGIFATCIASYVLGAELVWWHVLVGIVFAMSPDIDAISELLKRGKVSASAEHAVDHRTFLHWPVFSLTLGCVAWILFGYFGLMWLIAIALHLINDLYGTGWGIPALWPITNDRFKIFGRRVNRLKFQLQEDNDWNDLSHNERKFRFLVHWNSRELPHYIQRWGQENWIARWYLNLNWVSGIEYMLFLGACVLLFFTVG